MFETNDYQEAKDYFERSCAAGWNHIYIWILSPKFHHEYMHDPIKAPGSRIRVAPIDISVAHLEMVQHTIKGYEIVISDGFDHDYGMAVITKNGKHERVDELLEHNVSKDHNFKWISATEWE